MITIWEQCEDFDNSELPADQHQEQIEDSIRSYNEEHGTNYDPYKTYIQYLRKKSLTTY